MHFNSPIPGADDRTATAAGLSHVVEQLGRAVRLLTTKTGLTTAALLALHQLLSNGPQRITALAQSERVSQPGMTQLVGRLEREGLVRRRSIGTDRRGVIVEATAAGREFVDSRRAERSVVFEQLLGQLDAHDQAAIAAALPALGRLVASPANRIFLAGESGESHAG
jgi:DNA-binding MarR family transcriptional regulator